MTTLSVTGIAVHHLRAERATLTARVSFSAPNRTDSMRGAAELHQRLVASAQQLRTDGRATWHEAGPSATSLKTWTEQGSKRSEHVTNSTVKVKLRDLALVAEVIDTWSHWGASVATSWSLTEATKQKHQRQLRRLAIVDARARATDFATALEQQIVGVTAVKEQGDWSQPTTRSQSASSGPPEVAVAELTMECRVSVDFETE